MPKSKRNKVVSLTKVKKKTKEWKGDKITATRNFVDEFPSVYLFRYENMRNESFKSFREDQKEHSRFVMGSNKVLRVALGHGEEDEYKKGLSALAEDISGSIGLFFTRLPEDQVLKLFEEFEDLDYARAGSQATEDFDLAEGPLSGPTGPLPHTVEPTLRKYGLPTRLKKGVVELVSDFVVCQQGDTLTSNQAALLRVFDVKMAAFRMYPVGCWLAEDEHYHRFEQPQTASVGPHQDAPALMEEMQEQ
ncbi:g2112 [Coccomyxa viridis]|uniref:Ribosome assembly factor mrt4 n=1 Tax=Coccomyxa viridis TaxID=1274662 RepID=A0ABP1FJK0_9CHLO